MKTVTQLLSMILCFEIVMGPMQGSFISNVYAEEKTCPAGQSYSPDVNRCLTTAEVIKVNNKVQTCGENKDCYEKNAKDALSDSGAAGKDDMLYKGNGSGERTNLAFAATSAVMAIPLLIATNTLLNKWQIHNKETRKRYKCNPPSLLLMYAGAAALGAGEVVGFSVHKSKLDDIQKDWDKTVVPKKTSGLDKNKTEATEAQSQAFEFLAQNEDQVAATTRLKRGFYFASTGLFAAGTAAAIVEQVHLKRATLDVSLNGRTKIKAGTLKLGTATAAQGMAEIQEGRKLIQDGQDTINKLTCSTDSREMTDDAKDAEKSGKASEESYNKSTKDESERVAREKAYETSKSKAKDDIAAANRNKADKTPGNEAYDQEKLDAAKKQLQDVESQHTKDYRAPAPKPNTEEAPRPGDDELNCKGKWNENGVNGGFCETSTSTNEKIRRVALHNLSTASDAEQLMQLYHEMNSVEFENYSRVTYLDDRDARVMKQISFKQMISNALIPDAKAFGIMDAVSGLGTLASILPQVGDVLKGIKSKNGRPVTPEELGADKAKVQDQITKLIGKPTTRIALNSILGGWIGFMTIHMSKQANISEKRAEKLRLIKKDFVSANGLINCSESDRSNPEKPNCYCYTPENKINPARSSKPACENKLATLDKDNSAAAAADTKVCVTQALAVDAACSCRNTKGADGKNSCLKAGAGFASLNFNPGTFKMITAGASPANDLFSGNASGADISDSAGINAARIREASDAVLAKVDPKAAKESKDLAAALDKSMLATAGGYSMGNQGGTSALPSSPQAAAAALNKELKDNKESSKNSSSSTGAGFTDLSGTKDDMPDFGLSGQGGTTEDIEIAEVMGKEVDFGSNDITKTKDTNLFDLLSNRYQRSAIKRLFEDGKPADAPADKEIND